MQMQQHSDAFDVIPFQDIKGDWKKLGAGSFGNVYKGNYLGIEVAIKEVLPSKDYDVAKYFEREWRLMKECRHPNICLFLGLSRAPDPDKRIFIVSEFIENGNVRMYIHDKTKPFPWRLRMSFATDVTRALAYLHARKCIHRDLKGENLLVTENGRLKITDFGFARIAARNEEESKRLTFCGTDSYMSPEILIGDEFDLPTDIYSLGIIFCEIASRTLADDYHFKRTAPTFTIDPDEIRKLASPGCPEEFMSLCLDCLATEPSSRPTTRDILERLRLIEAEVHLQAQDGEDAHLGSIKLMGGKKHATPRIPDFNNDGKKEGKHSATSDDSDDELMEAVEGLSKVGLGTHFSDDSLSDQPLLNREATETTPSEYSTTVIRSLPSSIHPQPSSMASVLTIRASPNTAQPPDTFGPTPPAAPGPPKADRDLKRPTSQLALSSMFSIDSFDSYHTAKSVSAISSTMATEGGSTVRSTTTNYLAPLVHRFTLVKPGAKPKNGVKSGASSPSANHGEASGWNPLDLFFSSGLLVSKCDVCSKRIGWKPLLECDDCGLRTHLKCGEVAPLDCGVNAANAITREGVLYSMSPLSRVKHNANNAYPAAKKSHSPVVTR